MINLFKTELLRHSTWMLIAAVTHFFALYYLFWLNVPFTAGSGALGWTVATCVFAGAFGATQMKLYKRGNDWVYLLHRPLRPGNVHLALLLAGTALLALVLLIPALLMLVIMHVDGRFGTELRHYQIVAYGAVVAMTAYGVGQFAVLNASRLAFLAVVLACIFMYEPYGNTERLVTHPLLMLWALAIAHLSFKSDLERFPGKPATLFVTELPIVLGCYMVFSLAFGLSALSQRTTSPIFGNPAPDSLANVGALDDVAQLRFALASSTHPDARFLEQQSTLGEIIPILPPLRASYPQRHQLSLRDDKITLRDTQTNTSWLFSHSDMLYEGRDIASGERAGWLGPEGFHGIDAPMPALRFNSIPLAASNDYLVDDHSIYQIDWQQRILQQRFANDGNERFSDSLLMSENFATIFSDRRLLIFNMADLLDADIALLPRASLEMSFPASDGTQVTGGVQVMELINGYLVLAFVDTPPPTNVPGFVMQGKARLQVWRLLPGSSGELITSAPLGSSYSEFAQYADLVLSPGVRAITDVFWGFKLRMSMENTFTVLHADFPRWVFFAILSVCVFCGGLTAWLLRNSRLPAKTRNFWIVLCALSGLPGLLAFLVGHYWGGRDRLRLPLPAPTIQTAHVPA